MMTTTPPATRDTAPDTSRTSDPLIWYGTALSLLLSLLLPLLSWFPPGGTAGLVLATACTFWVGGPGLAAFLTGHSRLLWMSLAPALSLALLIIVSLLQAGLGLWHPPSTATVLALTGAASSSLWLSRHPVPRPGMPRTLRRGTGLSLLGIGGALLLWWWATRIIDLDAAGGLGLLAVLPVPFHLALVLLVTVVATTLFRAGRVPDAQSALVLGAAAVATVVTLTLLVNVADGGATMGTAYVHVGFADAIVRDGTLLESIDARFSWAGFFTAFATTGAWSGAVSLTPLLIWYPAVIGVLYLPAIFLIARTLTGDLRAAWLSLPLFFAVNWSQQEYFSPQSVALLFYFAVLAVIAHEIMTTPAGDRRGSRWFLTTPPRPEGAGAGRVIRAEVAMLLIAVAMVMSHQLTPVALIVFLAAAALVGLTRHRTLWIGVALAFSLWFVFGASDWWTGHLPALVSEFGQVGQALSSGVGDRVDSDGVHRTMQIYRILWTGFIALLAGLVWFTLEARARMFSALLIAAPASLVLAQSYGGEIFLRVLLYTSIALVPLAALAVVKVSDRFSRPAVPAGLLLLVALVAGVTARGVNVSFERTPSDVVEAATELLTIAPSGSTVRPLSTEGTLRIARVTELSHPATVPGDDDPFDRLLRQAPDYVFLTSMRESYEHLVNQAPADWYGDIAEDLVATGDYRMIHRSGHVHVLERLNSRGLPLSEDPGVLLPGPEPTESENS